MKKAWPKKKIFIDSNAARWGSRKASSNNRLFELDFVIERRRRSGWRRLRRRLRCGLGRTSLSACGRCERLRDSLRPRGDHAGYLAAGLYAFLRNFTGAFLPLLKNGSYIGKRTGVMLP